MSKNKNGGLDQYGKVYSLNGIGSERSKTVVTCEIQHWNGNQNNFSDIVHVWKYPWAAIIFRNNVKIISGKFCFISILGVISWDVTDAVLVVTVSSCKPSNSRSCWLKTVQRRVLHYSNDMQRYLQLHSTDALLIQLLPSVAAGSTWRDRDERQISWMMPEQLM